MRNTRCAMNPESDCEGRGAGGAVTVSRSRTLRNALLLWAAAGAMLFGGGLAAQAQSFTPGSPECTDSGTTVTCTGDLSGGVQVNSPHGTYNTLKVNTLNGDIAPEAGTSGINFDTHNEDTDTYGNTDITLTVDTGANGITTKGTNARGISARSAGDVTVNVTGKITAKGICHISDNQECSEGVYARSEDDGDVTVNVTGDIETEGDPDMLIGLGTTSSAGIYAKSGGGGGEDGDVTVTFRGNIKAKQRSRGIYANSDGAVTVNMKKGSNIITEGINADGIVAKSDGDGDVMVTVDGNINTLGEEQSSGIAAKSDGDGDVTVTVTGNIKTSGEDSEGISADSGGDGDVTVTMTGDITTSDEGSDGIYVNSDKNGDVTVNVTGDITTYGESSGGISAASDGDVTVDLEGDITTTKKKSRGISAYIEDENSAGNIDITVVTGDITTSGEESEGIYAESYGKGDVTVTMKNGSTITTSGEESEGIYALSYGNGAVTVNFTGDITTSGGNSSGIYAYSDNDSGTDNPNSSAVVKIDVTGDITASGDTSTGIYAQSNGAISITLHGGTITSAKGAGVEISNGATNTLTIRGPVTVRGGERIRSNGVLVEYDDVLGGSGDETIDNWGTLTAPGTIDLGAGANSFNNMAGATFNSGTAVILSLNNRFTNWGDLSPGGASAVQETALTGIFLGEQGSTFTVTTGPNGSSDLLTVTGLARLGGTVRVVGAYEGTYTILDADRISTIKDKFDEVIGGSLFMDYELDYLDDGDVGDGADYVELAVTRNSITIVEVTGVTGSANQRAAANALDSLELDSLEEDNSITQAILGLNTAEEVRAASDALSGEAHASLKGALMDTGQRQVAAVKSRMNGRFGDPGAQTSDAQTSDAQTSDARTSTAAFGNPSSLADRDSGSWITGYGAWGETDATPGTGTARMETDLRGVLFGADRALGDHWRLGVLGGYSRTDVSQRARLSSASVDTWSAGLYGGAEAGAWGLGFGAIHNWHAVDTSRTVSFTNYSPERLSAGYDARSWQLFAEAGYEVQAGALMLEPFAGVSHTNLATDGFSESGGDAALAASSDTNNTTFTTLGLRGAIEVDDMIHLRGMAGWRYAFGDTDPSSTATLRGSTTAFTVTGAPTAEDSLVTEFGVEAGLSANAFLGLAYKGRYGDGAAAHGFNAGLRVTF